VKYLPLPKAIALLPPHVVYGKSRVELAFEALARAAELHQEMYMKYKYEFRLREKD
jgi:hypothetical protein